MRGCTHPHHQEMGMPTVDQVRWAEQDDCYVNTIHRGFELMKAGDEDAAIACFDDSEEQMREA